MIVGPFFSFFSHCLINKNKIKINLKKHNDHTNPLFVDKKLLKLKGIIEMSYELWNNLLKTDPEISNSVSINSLIHTLKSYYLNTYSTLLPIN